VEAANEGIETMSMAAEQTPRIIDGIEKTFLRRRGLPLMGQPTLA
jgi:hypothetical protein